MSKEVQINEQLMKEDIFQLFRLQMKKDFEGAGLDGDFTDALPFMFEELKKTLLSRLDPLISAGSHSVPSLLYRVDISEKQLMEYQEEHPGLHFPEVMAELLIKRILQKVILKKNFSR